jgi:hypothetical protein
MNLVFFCYCPSEIIKKNFSVFVVIEMLTFFRVKPYNIKKMPGKGGEAGGRERRIPETQPGVNIQKKIPNSARKRCLAV